METFVLVPGAWKGAWAYEAVVPLLERAGHAVHALTLTGLWPDDDDATVATANLDTHADDVLRHLDRARITSATLVGHSYGGLVIAAAADRVVGRISRLVHLDAFVPRDGESWWSSTNQYFRDTFVAGAATTGYAVQPPEGGSNDPRRRPHPTGSFLQTIRLAGALAQVPRREFVYCSGWEDQTPFAELRTRLEADPGWQVHDLPTGHDAMHEAPEATAALLLGGTTPHTAGRGKAAGPVGTIRSIAVNASEVWTPSDAPPVGDPGHSARPCSPPWSRPRSWPGARAPTPTPRVGEPHHRPDDRSRWPVDLPRVQGHRESHGRPAVRLRQRGRHLEPHRHDIAGGVPRPREDQPGLHLRPTRVDDHHDDAPREP